MCSNIFQKLYSQIKNAVCLQEIIFVFICNLNPRELQKMCTFSSKEIQTKISKKSNFLVEEPVCLFVMFHTLQLSARKPQMYPP